VTTASGGLAAVDLDDPAAMRRIDVGDMLGTTLALGEQCRAGYAIGRAVEPLPTVDDVTSIVFCGMGGSAIAGDVLRVLAAERVHAPVVVLRAPELPAFVTHETLAIVSSYSGGTAETLSLFEEAHARGARVVALTSGGELGRRAEEEDHPVARVPGGLMPRAAFGYLTMATLGMLETAGLVSHVGEDLDEALEQIDRVAAANAPDRSTAEAPAKELARRIGDRSVVVWGADGVGAVAAARWKAQFNENAKLPAFASALPELDHNEVVGWSEGRGEGYAVLALRQDVEHPDVAERFPLSLEIARISGAEVEEIRTHARSPLARLLDLVQRGDLVSTYTGIARGVDPSPIDAIARLKAALAEAS
jgi:glucose/mannose-6-phosphate isomerase